jgi:hypothetical protein
MNEIVRYEGKVPPVFTSHEVKSQLHAPAVLLAEEDHTVPIA